MSILSSLLGLGKGQPTQMIPQTVQTEKIAEEVAPFIKDILGKGQALYKQRMDEGFVPFEGQTLADVSADQLAAQQGLRGLVGSQAGGLQEARDLVRGQTQQATTETLQPFMNPYQQAVTDISKRTAQERFESETLPGLRKQAIDAGAFGGSRAAMRESQAQDAQARLLADIQAKGDLASFQDARQAFEAQKTRERQAAEGLSGLTGAEFQAKRAELGGLEAVGREEQQRQQQLLDESYKRFLDERAFPEQQLGAYQGVVQGASPLIGTASTTRTPQQFQPSPIASALGTIGTGLGTYSAAKDLSLFSKEGGQVVPAEEGTPGGLRAVIIKIMRAQRGKGGDPRSKRSERERTQMQQEDVTRMLEEMDMKSGGLVDLPVVQRQNNGRVFTQTESGIEDFGGMKDERFGTRAGDMVKGKTLAESEARNEVNKNRADIAKSLGLSANATDAEINERRTELMNMADNQVIETTDADDNRSTGSELVLPSQKSQEDAYDAMMRLSEMLATDSTRREDEALAGIKEEKEQIRREKARDFIMGVSRGLLKGGTSGGIAADLVRGGEEGVEAIKGYGESIRNLSREERQVANEAIDRQANLLMNRYKLQLDKGQLSQQDFNNQIALIGANSELLRAGLTMDQAVFDAGISTLSQSISDPDKLKLLDQNPIFKNRPNEKAFWKKQIENTKSPTTDLNTSDESVLKETDITVTNQGD
jgi:hypothetical protein